MRIIKLNKVPEPSFKEGNHSYVSTDIKMEDYYGKNRTERRLGLKIFTDDFVDNVNVFMWKNNNFMDCTKIQNLFAFYELAPRVFDIVILDTPKRKFYAQVIEVIENNERGDFNDNFLVHLMLEVRNMYGILIDSVDPNPNHQYKRFIVDFSHYKFHQEVYEAYIVKSFSETATWGSSPKPYQTVEELGIDGQRNLKKRLEAYEFDKIDFKGKTVIDYGCSGGHMAQECLKRGAKYVVGLDLPQVIVAAFEMSNHLGFFNIDYFGGNFDHKNQDVYSMIQKFTGEKQFDIVLYLSVQQLGMPDYLPQIMREYFFLEGHSGDHDYTYKDILKKLFSRVEYLGASHDHSARPVFRCSNI